jgi:hypothetical protein
MFIPEFKIEPNFDVVNTVVIKTEVFDDDSTRGYSEESRESTDDFEDEFKPPEKKPREEKSQIARQDHNNNTEKNFCDSSDEDGGNSEYSDVEVSAERQKIVGEFRPQFHRDDYFERLSRAAIEYFFDKLVDSAEQLRHSLIEMSSYTETDRDNWHVESSCEFPLQLQASPCRFDSRLW